MPFRIDKFKIDTHELVGDRLRVDGYMSRTGVQTYDQGDGTVQREQRDPDQVFAKGSLESARGIPVTVGHPKNQMVDSGNWRALSHGHVGDDPRPAEDGMHTKASLWIMDKATQDRITGGELKELSGGYYADLDETPGVNDKGEKYDARQINIQWNHVALLKADQARGGKGCRIRLDSNGDAQYEDEQPGDPVKREKRKMKIKIKADGYDHEVEADSDSLVVALEKERTGKAAVIEEMTATLDGLKAKLDAETEKTTELTEKLTAATDPKAISDAIEATIKIRTDAAKVAGKEIKTDGTPHEIRCAALKEIGIETEGKSEAYVEARFDGKLEDGPRIDHLGAARLSVVGDPELRTDDDDLTLNLADELSNRLAGKAGN